MTAFPELDKPCTVCASTGVVPSVEWQAWYERYDPVKQRLISAGLAFLDAVDQASAEAGEQPHCNEEETCGECEGLGRVLTEDGSLLIGFLVDHDFIRQRELRQALRPLERRP